MTHPQKFTETYFDWAARQAKESRQTCQRHGHQPFVPFGAGLMICPRCGDQRASMFAERRQYRKHNFTENAV